MLLLVALVMFVNYVDRGNLAIAAPVIQKAMNLDAGRLGVLFSAFAWTYLLCIPFAGLLLDRLGPQITLSLGILGWSLATLFTGMTNSFWQLLACRMALGIFEAPVIPTNMRCVSAWFPQRQRGLAIGLYTAMQPVALAVMAPTVTWALLSVGWRMVFYATGALGLLTVLIWQRFYRDPMRSPRVSPGELAVIRNGGGLVDTELEGKRVRLKWSTLGRLLRERQLISMFIGQYALMTTLYFFLTWFPSYLANAKGLTIAQSGKYSLFPFLLAICGALIGGKWSDWMVTRGVPLGTARKAPIIVGLLLGTAMVAANYTTDLRLVIVLMGLAFFGESIASTVTGALLTDIAPKGAVGAAGGLLTFFSNLGSALSPLIIGFGVQRFGGFEFGLLYVSIVSAAGAAAYVFLIGKVERIVLTPNACEA